MKKLLLVGAVLVLGACPILDGQISGGRLLELIGLVEDSCSVYESEEDLFKAASEVVDGQDDPLLAPLAIPVKTLAGYVVKAKESFDVLVQEGQGAEMDNQNAILVCLLLLYYRVQVRAIVYLLVPIFDTLEDSDFQRQEVVDFIVKSIALTKVFIDKGLELRDRVIRLISPGGALSNPKLLDSLHKQMAAPLNYKANCFNDPLQVELAGVFNPALFK